MVSLKLLRIVGSYLVQYRGVRGTVYFDFCIGTSWTLEFSKEDGRGGSKI